MIDRNLRLIASPYAPQYKTDAKIYVDEAHPSGQRHLIAQYETGRPEFAAAIPNDWSDRDIMDLLFPMRSPEAPFPPWEVPARAFGSVELFRWWAGEKAS
jgi:hypothetical protein